MRITGLRPTFANSPSRIFMPMTEQEWLLPSGQVDLAIGCRVGPQGRDATTANAIAGATSFDLGPDEAKAIVEEMRARFRLRSLAD